MRKGHTCAHISTHPSLWHCGRDLFGGRSRQTEIPGEAANRTGSQELVQIAKNWLRREKGMGMLPHPCFLHLGCNPLTFPGCKPHWIKCDLLLWLRLCQRYLSLIVHIPLCWGKELDIAFFAYPAKDASNYLTIPTQTLDLIEPPGMGAKHIHRTVVSLGFVSPSKGGQCVTLMMDLLPWSKWGKFPGSGHSNASLPLPTVFFSIFGYYIIAFFCKLHIDWY